MKLPFSKKSEKETTQVRNVQSSENLAAQQEFQKAEKSYNRDIAITTSVPLIKKIAFGAWMVFDIVLVGFFVVYLGLYLSNGIFSDSKLVA
ncbi:hypothetical protein KJ766_02135, partial [Patescibacteria group bacterium]|nr:hypothetical protein [Patescibacteria group bacterium]